MVVVIFVKNNHILLADITNATEEYFFTRLSMVKREKDIIENIILSMYKDNIQIRRKGDLLTFHKVDLPLLWFFNTIGYRKQLILACFVDDSIYESLAPNILYCDNYFYSLYEGTNVKKDSGIPEWELYDITMKHFLYYLETNEWCRHQEDIIIAKEIDIRPARFELKESEKVQRYNLTGQVSTVVKRVAIVK